MTFHNNGQKMKGMYANTFLCIEIVAMLAFTEYLSELQWEYNVFSCFVFRSGRV